jgi:hypothetical protein
MSTITQVEQLRATARHLRSMSSLIGSSGALTVYSLAGPDTWVGPTAQACHEELLALRHRSLTNQQTLTDSALRLERRADSLALQPSPVGGAS